VKNMATVYTCLLRPKLHHGAAWLPMMLVGVLSLFLVWSAFAMREWWLVGAALAEYWIGGYLLRETAKRDPQWFEVYARAWGQPFMRKAQPRVEARERKPKPLLPRISHWVK
jgi:type IV secretory pathway TrbD component